MHKQPTVFIVDNNQDFAQSLSCLVQSVGYAVSVFHSPQLFLETYQADSPGCLLLDIRMPFMSGLELQEHLNKKNNILPIIFMTAHGDIPMAVRAMKSGAFEFLTKPLNNQILLEAINKAIKLDAYQREKLAKNKDTVERFARLTPREKQVMALMIKGDLTKVIAHKLHISQNTTELHRSKIMKKMGVKRLAELVTLAIANNLIAEDDIPVQLS